MKKAIVSFALVLVLSMSSFAGNKVKNERKEKCEFPCEQMVKELKEADKTFDTEVKAIREKKREFEKSNRESMKAAKVRRDSTFKSILTKDQYIQYLEQKVARLEKRADRDSWRERFRAPFMGKDMKLGRQFPDFNPLPRSEKNVEK